MSGVGLDGGVAPLGWRAPGALGRDDALGEAEVQASVRRLALAWWTLAVVALGLSTVGAVILVAARTPFLGLGGEFFRVALVLHVDLAVVVWFLAVAAGIWVAAASNGEGRGAAWAGLTMAAVGILLLLASPWWGAAVPILANYIPVIDSPPFLFGLGLFAGGVTLAALATGRGWQAAVAKEPWRLAAGAALIAFLVAMIVLLLANIGAVPGVFETRVWGAGHVLQVVHTLMLMAAWLAMGSQAFAEVASASRCTRALIALALLPALGDLALAVIFRDDAVAYRQGFTEVMRWASWPAPLALGAMLVLGYRRRAQHASLKGQDWAVVASFALFSLGCLVGAGIRSDSTSVPAHYHGTVGAVTLAYMVWGRRWLAYFGVRLGRECRVVQWQPFVYAAGICLLVIGLAWSGWLGVPRKSPHTDLQALGSHYWLAMGLAGVGGGLATLGSALFVGFLGVSLANNWNWRDRMTNSDEPQSAAEYSKKRDERWRLWLLLAVVVVFAGLTIDRWRTFPVTGSNQAQSHAKSKRLEEVQRRFKEGVVMLHAKEYEHALTAFHRVLELAPELPEAHVNAGYALLGMGKAEAARDFFDAATTLKPDQLNAYYGLAEALEAMGQTFGAMQAMETYLHRAPAEDPYRRKAEAAVWELRQKLAEEQGRTEPPGGEGTRGKSAPPAGS